MFVLLKQPKGFLPVVIGAGGLSITTGVLAKTTNSNHYKKQTANTAHLSLRYEQGHEENDITAESCGFHHVQQSTRALASCRQQPEILCQSFRQNLNFSAGHPEPPRRDWVSRGA